MTSIRTLAPLASIVLVVAYSVIATASSGALTAIASPMLIAAVALAFWHDGTEASTATRTADSTANSTATHTA